MVVLASKMAVDDSSTTTADFEAYLSSVTLNDDNLTMLLNGESGYPVALPKYIYSKKKRDDRLRIVKKKIFEGCNDMYNIDYVSEQNVQGLTKEIVDLLYQRENIAAAAAAKEKIDEQAAEGGGGSNGETARAAKALELAIENSQELFLDEFGRAFAAMRVNAHVEIHPMDEQHFKNWISGIYYNKNNALLNDDDLKKIVRILTARAEFDRNGSNSNNNGGGISRYGLDLRVRGYNSNNTGGNSGGGGLGYVVGGGADLREDFDTIYYDLSNDKWESVKITAEGWDIDKNPPILFRRYGGELPQPYPDRNYKPTVLDEYLELLNLKREHKDMQKQLLKPLNITGFWPSTIPKPVLILPASQGSGKTTGFELIKHSIDPSSALTMSLPKEEVNLKQSLAHNYMSFFDNVSEIKDWQSDVICRGVTGAGDMKRMLFENDKDVIYKYRRFIGLNGITNAITRADLLDRGIYIEFGEIAREDRELLRVIWRKYLELKPKLLAFCFDVISEVMKERQKWKGIDEDYFGMKELIKEKGGLPRMADWCILAEQVSAIIARKEGKPYTPGDFLDAFNTNLEMLNTEALKVSLVAEALITFMTEREAMGKGPWEGSATQLLSDLTTFIAIHDDIKIDTFSKSWPRDPATLGKEIAKIKTNLAPLGIKIGSDRTSSNVIYTISKVAKVPTLPTLPTSGDKPETSPNVGNVGNVGKIPTLKIAILLEITTKLSGDKGYFELKEWLGEFVFRPIQDPYRCDEDQAKKMLEALIDDGMIEEFSPGKYRPTQKLRTEGAGGVNE